MIIDDVIARLGGEVSDLSGRVEGALELAELVKRDALPQAPIAAFVCPTGLVARSDGDASAIAFTQMVDDMLAVVLVMRRAGDVRGSKSRPKLDLLIWAVIEALSGWGPDDAIGVLALRRGALVSLTAGTAFYQLDFAIQQQIRILS
jgi:hypothetical protein